VYPIIFELGKFRVYSYSLLAVLAFSCALIYAYFEAKRIREDPEKVIDLAIYLFISGLLGAYLLNVMVNWRIYIKDPLRIFHFWEGGLVYYGGFILACLVALVYIKWHNLNLRSWADLLAPCAMIILAIGRIGCFLNGCCYGKPAPEWLPLKKLWIYPLGRLPLELEGIPLHPTQLYCSLLSALIVLFLIWRSRRKKFPGEVFWLMLFLYSLTRFFIEFFRADQRGGIASLHLSTSQLISIVFFALASFFLAKNYFKTIKPNPRGEKN